MLCTMSQPPQEQTQQPGREHKMEPQPKSIDSNYTAAGKLAGKVAIITGGDSGIGRAIALAFAKEGAKTVLVYLEENKDARDTEQMVTELGGDCTLLEGDIGDDHFCQEIVTKTLKWYGKVDCVINNAAEQHPQDSLTDITNEQLEKTFRTNIFSQFYLTRAALSHLEKGSTIINTTSVTAYRGSAHLLDYSSTKGAIVAFTRSLSQQLAEQGIRVNGVAPGPIWTPLIPSTFSAEHVKSFGDSTPLGRAGQPEEIAPCYVFLASDDSSYMTGQILHPNGGEIING